MSSKIDKNVQKVKPKRTKKRYPKKVQGKNGPKAKKGPKQHPYKAGRDKKPSNVITVPPSISPFQSQIVVSPEWNVRAVNEMMAAMTSFFLARAFAGEKDYLIKMQQLYDGMFTQWVKFTSEVAGVPSLETRLQVIHDLIAAFSKKTITKRKYSKVSYSWDGISTPTSGAYNTGWNTWDFVLPDADTEAYNSPCTVVVPVASDSSYSEYMSQVQAISSMSAPYLFKKKASDPSVLDGDPSAFAKVYGYVGLNPSLSGSWYNSVENEVAIRAPILSHNVVYPTEKEDDRVAEKLTTNEGGPAANLAPLLGCFDNWFNTSRLSFKFLDFNEIVYSLVYWYIRAAELAYREGDISASEVTLAMTLQDFQIVVRQMILSNFKDQWIGQFIGPLNYENSATNFLPFQVLGNCYGNEYYRTLLVPPLVAENLSMLQTVACEDLNQKSTIKKTVYVPVWGYYNDVPPVFSLPIPEEPGSIPIFQVGDQKIINLVDCTISGNFINANGTYYNGVMSRWNDAVNRLKKYVNVANAANLAPPSNAALLLQTRVFGYSPEKRALSVATRSSFPCLRYITNIETYAAKPQRQSLSKNDKKTAEPTLPTPTDVDKIVIDEQTSTFPLARELYELSHYMTLPCVRFDPTSSNDILNKVMYQTITYEGLSQIQNANTKTPAYLVRCDDVGSMCVEGAGKITGSTISTVLSSLAAKGNGGMLASLLGGVAKSLFPDASGLIDTVATDRKSVV